VRLDARALESYADALPLGEITEPAAEPGALPPLADAETAAAWALTLDCVNFGSGWFPELRKHPGLSGYRTIEASLRERFAREGRLVAEELARADRAFCARLFGQDPRGRVADLMALFAEAWRELGRLLVERFDGSFLALARAGGDSAELLIAHLLTMPLWRDVAEYDGAVVAFLKRAQIAAFDLWIARPADFPFRDLDRLTIFADNLVPHVLRIDGVLVFEPELVARIERGELLAHGSPEEVEIRACGITAVERLAAALARRRARVRPCDLDLWLWRRGGARRYKDRPRHRSRCPYY
jgi:hypothetical protein